MRGFLLGAALIVACGSSEDVPFGNSSSASASSTTGGPSCVPGQQATCPCVGGEEGTQICNASGTGFGPCDCGSGDAGGGGAGGQGGSGGGSMCEPASRAQCYTGAPGTSGVGLCVPGTKTCKDDGSAFGPCVGEVVPQPEICATPGDDDCDGMTNEDGPDCACAPGSQSSCYSAPPATKDVGPCIGGTQQCKADGTGYGPCVGEITPKPESCSTPVDDDCDGQVNEGGIDCVCAPSATEACYDGASGTENVGPCKGGTHTCNALGTAWGPCVGEVVPQPDLCATPLDEDCNGSPMPCVTGTTWSKDIGTAGIEQPGALAVDGAGNVVVSSTYGLMEKYDGTGNLLWSKQLPVTGVNGLAFKAGGNLLATGYFTQAFVDLGGGALVSQGGGEIFVVELDAAGNHVWSKRYGTASNEAAAGIAVDASGNIVIAGSFENSTDLGGGLIMGNPQDCFVAKLDPNGNHVWSKGFGDSNYQYVTAVAVDAAGAALFTGNFAGTVDFGGGPLVEAGNGDVFVAKLDASGSHVWSKRYGDAKEQVSGSIAADGAGNVLATGGFQGAVDFGGGTLVAGMTDKDVYVVKLAADGTHVWSKRFGDGYDQIGFGVANGAGNNVLLTGLYKGAPDFGGGSLPAILGNTQTANFIAKLDASGNHVWSHGYGDGDSQYGSAVATDSAGYVFQLGANLGTIDFGDGPLVSNGFYDMTLAKLTP